MGAAHVSACFAQWSHLPDRPFRLLAYMALIAKDSTPEPTFWGGRDALCIALGLEPSTSAYRAARRAVAELLDAGALERKYVGHAGKRSEYRVMVTPRAKGDGDVPQSGGEPKGKGGHQRPPEGGHLSPQRGTPVSAKEDTSVPPRTTRNTRSESEEEISSLTQPSPRARDEKALKDLSTISPFDAKRIVREFIDQGGVLADLITDMPAGLTRTQRDQWAATKIAKEAS